MNKTRVCKICNILPRFIPSHNRNQSMCSETICNSFSYISFFVLSRLEDFTFTFKQGGANYLFSLLLPPGTWATISIPCRKITSHRWIINLWEKKTMQRDRYRGLIGLFISKIPISNQIYPINHRNKLIQWMFSHFNSIQDRVKFNWPVWMIIHWIRINCPR